MPRKYQVSTLQLKLACFLENLHPIFMLESSMSSSKKVVWNLSHLYSGDNDPRMENEFAELQAAHTAFESKWRSNSKYLTDEQALYDALEELEHLIDTYCFIGKAGYYWILRDVQDQRAAKTKEMKTKMLALESESVNKIAFFGISLAKIPPQQQAIFLASDKLKKYRHYLKTLFDAAKYTLSEGEEKVLTLMSQPAEAKWNSLRSAFLSKETCLVLTESGKVEKRGFEELFSLAMSKKQVVRDSAGKQINRILRKHAALAEHELNAILMTKKIENELRKAKRPDELVHQANDIASSIVDTVIETVTQNFSLSQRYYRLKAQLVGKKQLEYYERAVEYGEITKEFTFDEATKLVSKAFHRVDAEFGAMFDGFIDDGLVDPFPQPGKHEGGACYHFSGSMPTYQYMNFTGKLTDVRTLAHESGHAINNVLSRIQHALDYGSSLATAEVASTFMEGFVLDEIAAGLDKKQQLALNISLLDDQIASIFRQAALYNFETELHTTFKEKMYLTHEEIGQMFLKHIKSYMGDGITFSRGSENWWVYWPHIRRPFYVFSYVSGELISQSLSQSVKSDKSFVPKVKEFLAAGMSKSPQDVFAGMGIDISKKAFWEQGLKTVEELLDRTELLARALGN